MQDTSALVWYHSSKPWQELTVLAPAQALPSGTSTHARTENISPATPRPDPNSNAYPEHPRHKPLFPLSIADVLGWLLAVITLFIAAGVLSVHTTECRIWRCSILATCRITHGLRAKSASRALR